MDPTGRPSPSSPPPPPPLPITLSPPIPIQQRAASASSSSAARPTSPPLPAGPDDGGGAEWGDDDERRPLSPSLAAGGSSSGGGRSPGGQRRPQQQQAADGPRRSSATSVHTEASAPAATMRATLVRTATVTELVTPATARVGGRRMLSEVRAFPIPHPYPKKNRERPHRMDRPYSFIKTLFYVRGTVIESIWPQILLSVVLILTIKICQVSLRQHYTIDPRFNTIHTVLGSILAFITVFRTNRSYDSYIEGRKLVATIVNNLRTAMMDMYINDPRDGTQESRTQLVELAEDFRRKANVLYAFIRQSARECKEGFCPASDVGDVAFDAETFVLDPTRPRLADLLTEDEFQKFQRMRVNARPVYLMSEMNLLAYRIFSLSKDTTVRINIDQKFQDILASWNGMLRVVDLCIPFPYTHVVNMLTFIFVFGAPFIYTSESSTWSGGDVIIFASLVLAISFFGLEDMARRVANPFGWDAEDHDLEGFGIALNLDGQEIAHMCGVLAPAEFMPEPLFDDLPEKYQSISYKAFTRSASLSLEGLGGDSQRLVFSSGHNHDASPHGSHSSRASSVGGKRREGV